MSFLHAILDRVRPVKSGPSRSYRAEVVEFLIGDWAERGGEGREYRLDEEDAAVIVTLNRPLVASFEKSGMRPTFAANAVGNAYPDRLKFTGAKSARRA